MQRSYIIHRHKRDTIYLSPFQDITSAGKWDPEEPVEWYSASTLTMQEKNEATSTLYSSIDRGVDRWIQDMRYVPRLLAVALVFLATYFIFSLAVRDPLPLIDELLIAGAVSVVLWTFLTRKDKKSAVAMKKRLELKQMAGDAEIKDLPALDVLESYLADIASHDPLDICDRLALCGDAPLPPLVFSDEQRGPWLDDVYALLTAWVKVHEKAVYHRLSQVRQVRRTGKGDEALSARMVHQAMAGQLDVPLLSLCVAFSELS